MKVVIGLISILIASMVSVGGCSSDTSNEGTSETGFVIRVPDGIAE